MESLFSLLYELSSGSLMLLLLLAIVVVSLYKSAQIVPNQEAYVVERLGKFHKVLYAGFHILIPYLDVIAYKRILKELVLDVPQQTCITRDNVSVNIDGVIYLQVTTPEKSAYGIDDFLSGAIQLAQTALRSSIGKLELDRTFEERDTINQEVVAALNEATAPWGIKVLRYEIRDIAPPESVMQAMEKQMRAEREKRAVIAESEGQRQAQINKAEGERAALIAESEGKMQALKNQAEGEAALIETVAKATAEGLRLVSHEMQSDGGIMAANLRIAETWIQQYGQIAKEGTTMIVPQNMADVSGIVAGLSQIIKKNQ